MSEVMTQGIIGMPFDLAMSNELSRRQFHGRAQSLLSDYAALEAECERLQGLVKMLVRQHMPLEPVDGLDGWSEVISARKAIELRDAALTECERLRDMLREASVAMGEAHDSLFVQCFSNGITNAWGKPVNVSKINDLQLTAKRIDAALSAKP